MEIFQQIIFGLIATALGVFSLKYNYQLVGITGNVGFAERWLGAGSTYFFFKMLSVVLVIGGLLYATGLGVPVFKWLVSPLKVFFPQNTSL
jgi:hypothetical protein